MVGSLKGSSMDAVEKAEPLPEEIDPKRSDLNGTLKGSDRDREIILGRNLHTSFFEISEPEADDEVTGEKEVYMAGVLAKYRKSLIERTKHHLDIL